MVFISNFIILFYFIYLFIFYLFLFFILFFKGGQNFTLSVILDLELRFCTGRHLIREIVLKLLNMLFFLGPSRFIPLSSTTRCALQDALGSPRVPLTSSVPCAMCPLGHTTCSKGATCLLIDLVDIKTLE